MRTLGMVLLILGMSACAKKHPVQPTERGWTVPPGLASCVVREKVHFEDGWKVVLYCPNGVYLVDYYTKRPEVFVRWDEMK